MLVERHEQGVDHDAQRDEQVHEGVENDEREKLKEDVVIYLIVVIRSKLTLSHIIKRSEQKFFRKAYELMNYLGYRTCLKYLGTESIFMKRFTPVEREFHLPVFKTDSKT